MHRVPSTKLAGACPARQGACQAPTLLLPALPPPFQNGIQVDCEQTAANQALAAASGIRAFPTFHLYR